MPEEQIKAFLEAVSVDTGLQEELKGAADADAVVAVAKAAGFVISAEDLEGMVKELSEEELQMVAGGSEYSDGFLAAFGVSSGVIAVGAAAIWFK